jgi:hypothetical protein
MGKAKAVDAEVVTVKNVDIWEAFPAIQSLVQRGWGDARVALSLGRTNRRLRDKWTEIDDARKLMLKKYGTLNEKSGETEMKDRAGFDAEWRKLMMDTTTLDVYPVSVTAVLSRVPKCDTCHRGELDDITASALEVLVHIGAIREDGSTA